MTSLAIGNSVIINNVDLHVNDTDLASKIYLISEPPTPLYPPPDASAASCSNTILILFIHCLLLLSFGKRLRWVHLAEEEITGCLT